MFGTTLPINPEKELQGIIASYINRNYFSIDPEDIKVTTSKDTRSFLITIVIHITLRHPDPRRVEKISCALWVNTDSIDYSDYSEFIKFLKRELSVRMDEYLDEVIKESE